MLVAKPNKKNDVSRNSGTSMVLKRPTRLSVVPPEVTNEYQKHKNKHRNHLRIVENISNGRQKFRRSSQRYFV